MFELLILPYQYVLHQQQSWLWNSYSRQELANSARNVARSRWLACSMWRNKKDKMKTGPMKVLIAIKIFDIHSPLCNSNENNSKPETIYDMHLSIMHIYNKFIIFLIMTVSDLQMSNCINSFKMYLVGDSAGYNPVHTYVAF